MERNFYWIFSQCDHIEPLNILLYKCIREFINYRSQSAKSVCCALLADGCLGLPPIVLYKNLSLLSLHRFYFLLLVFSSKTIVLIDSWVYLSYDLFLSCAVFVFHSFSQVAVNTSIALRQFYPSKSRQEPMNTPKLLVDWEKWN